MLDRLTGKAVHQTIYFIGCVGIAIGLPWSKIPLSLGTALLTLNFLLKGNFFDAVQKWKSNRALLFFTAYLLIEMVSLLWSTNLGYGLKDLNTKLPLILLPFILTAKPFPDLKKIHWIALAFISSCFVISFINIGSYLHWWGNRVYDDFRGLSLFVSHIRFGLLIVLATVFCIVWFVQKLPYRLWSIPLLLWFLYYTYFAQIISGYLALVACFIFGGLLYFRNIKNKTIRYCSYAVTVVSLVSFMVWVGLQLQPVPHKVKKSELPKFTVNGTPYYIEPYDFWENGYPITGCLCHDELRVAWNKRSAIDYDTGEIATGQELEFTLWRYMTSKGLTKDSLGMTKMSDADVRNVEKGVNSILALEGGLKSRLYGIRYQLEYNDQPNGHSLLERFEYWKAAIYLIKKNWLTGVGIGDIQDEFDRYYEETHSKLTPENRHRAHEMYFTALISSGIFGLIFFVLWWTSQIRMAWNTRNIPWFCFIAISLSSFLTEDTIETQVGAVFIGFFFGLFAGNIRLFRKN